MLHHDRHLMSDTGKCHQAQSRCSVRDSQSSCCRHDQLSRHHASALTGHEKEKQHKLSLPNLREISASSLNVLLSIGCLTSTYDTLWSLPCHRPSPILMWPPGTQGSPPHTGAFGKIQDISAVESASEVIIIPPNGIQPSRMLKRTVCALKCL